MGRRGADDAWSPATPSGAVSTPAGRRWAFRSGLLLANGVLSLMGVLTSDAAFLSLGLAGAVPAQRAAGARRSVDPADDRREPAVPRGGERVHTKAGAPIVEVLRRYPKQVLLAVGARVGVDVAFYTFVLFITTYVATYLELPRAATPSTRC